MKKYNVKKSGVMNIQERAFSFACRIVKLYQFLVNQKNGMEILGRQILCSGTSVGANLEEAKAGQSKADFIAKCNIALKEARETNYWLRVFEKTKVVSTERLGKLTKESNDLVAILTTIVKNARVPE
ncbi:MAG: four helix bundle protein [Sedimentisphaerales bacterium]|nr:four helix bundle protein [Sedimentisphaerales bacterium]